MPPSTKRTRHEPRKDRRGSPEPAEHMSPSRAAKRRKQVQEPPPEPDDDDTSITGDTSLANTSDYDQLLAQVTQHLAGPTDYVVQASKDHANAIHEANKDGVQAYAKVAAQDWTYYVRNLTVNIGRASESANEKSMSEAEAVHIDLGPSKMVSRHHAVIEYENEEWYLTVRGRNGVRIDEVALKPGDRAALASGKVIEIAGVEMMFVLPAEISPLEIHETYLRRAGIARLPEARPDGGRANGFDTKSTGDEGPSLSSRQGEAARSQPSSFQQPIAPAPPGHKRPGTPSPTKGRPLLPLPQSPVGNSGTLLMNAPDGGLDLSLDENKHFKPQYSYAQMITQAIMNAPDGKLNLNGIYNFITKKYAYYRHQPANGWQNSIRHNLSLNKSFDKVARSTDEPGKGMKWQIVPEAREEMIHNAYKGGRGGHRGSSAPSSPNQLGYVNHGPKDMAAQEPTSARRRTGAGGRPRSAYHGTADEQPSDRGAGGAGGGPGGLESSPLASRSRRSDVPVSASDHVTPRSPALAPAAALATGGDGGGRVGGGDSEDGGGVGSLGGAASENEGGIFATPAPLRVAHPRLAPPSTMQRPSQHMLTSSPAPFWKFADIATPLKPDQLDLFSSPSAAVSREKGSGDVGGGAGNRDATTSPTTPSRIKGSATGPDKPGAASGSKKLDDDDDDDDEETSYDLTKGFQSIGSYHSAASRGLSLQNSLQGS